MLDQAYTDSFGTSRKVVTFHEQYEDAAASLSERCRFRTNYSVRITIKGCTVTFSWQDIEQDWLSGGNGLGVSPDEAVKAFNLVAALFGREWVEYSRVNNGSIIRGTGPTRRIITLGHLLEVLGDAPNSQHLLEKVRAGEHGAWAELVAIYLCRSGDPRIPLEVEPDIRINNRNRKPDFRIRPESEPWLYVEVTHPSRSAAQKEVMRGLQQITDLVHICTKNFALEVFLKREPTAPELDLIARRIQQEHTEEGPSEADLESGLGTMYWNHHAPGQIVLESHGEPSKPRLGAAGRVLGNGHNRHILVRWPFTDARAEYFLDTEAKQLPKDAPGIIMIQTSEAVGAMREWQALIERRFRPNMHTRVSAVCLFGSSAGSTKNGGQWRPECKVIKNPYARFRLPAWIGHQLDKFRAV